MVEIIARITSTEKIELTLDGSKAIEGVDAITPHDAIYLARNLIASALSILSGNKPRAGSILADSHIPIKGWAVGVSRLVSVPALVIEMPGKVEMTFLLSKAGAIELGESLVQQGQGRLPPDGARGTVH